MMVRPWRHHLQRYFRFLSLPTLAALLVLAALIQLAMLCLDEGVRGSAHIASVGRTMSPRGLPSDSDLDRRIRQLPVESDNLVDAAASDVEAVQPCTPSSHMPFNLLRQAITPAHGLELRSWWMPHHAWKVEFNQTVLCSDQSGRKTCKAVISLSTECSRRSIRAVHQFVPFAAIWDRSLRQLELSLFTTVAAKGSGGKLGKSAVAFAAVLLVSPQLQVQQKLVRLQLPTSLESERSQLKLNIDTNALSQAPLGVMVSVGCGGFSGSLQVADPLLLATAGPSPNSGALLPDKVVAAFPSALISALRQRGAGQSGLEPFPLPNLRLSGRPKHRDERPVNPLSVTLATQISFERLHTLEYVFSQWAGPVSVAIFVPNGDDIAQSNPGSWKTVYVEKKLQQLQQMHSSAVLSTWHQASRIVTSDGTTNRTQEVYPINELRNLALDAAPTNLVLISDGDFIPSPGLQEAVSRCAEIFGAPSLEDVFAGAVFVIPAFEAVSDSKESFRLAMSKEQLLAQIDAGEVQPFRASVSPLSHYTTDYQRWRTAETCYPVTASYQDKYEPYVVVDRTRVPAFDTMFSGYGMNKISFIMELYARGFEFYVLPDAWLTHLSHAKSAFESKFLGDISYRLTNRLHRFLLVGRLLAQAAEQQ